MTSLQELEAAGAFRSGQSVQREIVFTLDDGVERTFSVHVRQFSIADVERVLFDETPAPQGRIAKIIAESVTLGADGKERIPVERAARFHPSLAKAMMDAINQVNGKKPKN